MNCMCYCSDAVADESLSSRNFQSCSPYYFTCVSSGRCIHKSFVCDRDCHCSDCSDECGQYASVFCYVICQKEAHVNYSFT